MDRPVAESWGMIVGWLREHVPAAADNLQPPAPSSQLEALHQVLGHRLPDDLLEWLGLFNGFTNRGSFGYILPVLHIPIPVEDMLAQRDRLRRLFMPPSANEAIQPASETSDTWLDAFLPISDSGTDVELIVDLREGDSYGAVGEFDPEGGGLDAPMWTSTSEMLADVADALTLGHPALQEYARQHSRPWSPVASWEAFVDEGRLRWRPTEANDPS